MDFRTVLKRWEALVSRLPHSEAFRRQWQRIGNQPVSNRWGRGGEAVYLRFPFFKEADPVHIFSQAAQSGGLSSNVSHLPTYTLKYWRPHFLSCSFYYGIFLQGPTHGWQPTVTGKCNSHTWNKVCSKERCQIIPKGHKPIRSLPPFPLLSHWSTYFGSSHTCSLFFLNWDDTLCYVMQLAAIWRQVWAVQAASSLLKSTAVELDERFYHQPLWFQDRI